MNLFKKLLLVLCLAISVQPAYGWSWGGVASSVTNFITSSIPLFFSQAVKTASEHKAAVAIGVAGLLALTATKYAYGRYSDNKKAQEKAEELKKAQEKQRLEVEKQQRLEAERKAKEAEKLRQQEEERKAEELRIAKEEAERQIQAKEEELKKEEAARQAREEDERLEAERKREEEANRKVLEEEKRLKEQQEAERLEIERQDRERLQKRLQQLKAEKLAREERKKLEAVQEQGQINLKNNIFSESFRAPKKENDLSDFVKVEGLSDSGVMVENWSRLLLNEQSINKYLNFSKFHIGKCLSIDELSKLIADTSDYGDLIRSGAKLVWDIVYTDNIKNNIKYNSDAYDFYGLNSAQDQSHRLSYLADIIRVCWFMYSLALHKNEGFQEGSFVVYDKESRIFNFLLNYVKKVDPKDWNKDDPNNWKKEPVHITYNPYGCCRASTHIIECQEKGNKHYGIDIRFGSEIKKLTLRSAILPAGQTHILFGKVDDDRTFIKMENDGLYYKDGWDQHVEGAILSIGRKLPIIGNFVSWLFGSDDAPTNKKERMPNEFAQMAKNLGWKIKTIDDIIKICKENPAMYHTFMQDIIKKYPIDYKGRIGNEVILDACDLQCSYFYQEKATQKHKNAIEDFVRIRNLLTSFIKVDCKDKISALQIQTLVGSLGQLPAELSELQIFISSNNFLKHALAFK